MTKDKPLMAILGVIVLLVAASLVLFFIRRGEQKYLGENSPSAVAHDYILALELGDYQRAYGFLYNMQDKPDLFTFKQTFASDSYGMPRSAAQIGEQEITGDRATVSIILIQYQSGPLDQPYQNSQLAQLVKQNGLWKIASAPYPYWGYDWYPAEAPYGKLIPLIPPSTPAE
jgi:hypothetical protein